MRLWPCAKFRRREMFAAKLRVNRRAFSCVLRRERTATAQVAPAPLARVIGDALPQQAEHIQVSMRTVHARAAKLDEFAAHALEGREIKFLLAVITALGAGRVAGLQPVSAHDLAAGGVLDKEVIANGIERVGVTPGRKGM